MSAWHTTSFGFELAEPYTKAQEIFVWEGMHQASFNVACHYLTGSNVTGNETFFGSLAVGCARLLGLCFPFAEGGIAGARPRTLLAKILLG
jgi:hypothetical protein